jgi:hypothetical protein
MKKLFLALIASLALAVAACGPGADQPGTQPGFETPMPGDPGTMPGDPGTDPGTDPAP